MSQKVWDSIRSYLSEVYSIDFTGGGEPLLQPKLEEWIAEAKAADCETGFLSNGLLLRKQKLQNTRCVNKSALRTQTRMFFVLHSVISNPKSQLLQHSAIIRLLPFYNQVPQVSHITEQENKPISTFHRKIFSHHQPWQETGEQHNRIIEP